MTPLAPFTIFHICGWRGFRICCVWWVRCFWFWQAREQTDFAFGHTWTTFRPPAVNDYWTKIETRNPECGFQYCKYFDTTFHYTKHKTAHWQGYICVAIIDSGLFLTETVKRGCQKQLYLLYSWSLRLDDAHFTWCILSFPLGMHIRLAIQPLCLN